MILIYTRHDGASAKLRLSEKPITIGRSSNADIMLLDEKVSRLHCGITMEDGVPVVRDLKSKNGTFVNETRITTARLQPGDRIRVGSTILIVESEMTKGSQTILREVADEMAQGKGYSTLLKEIVEEVSEPPSPPVAAPSRKPSGKHVGRSPKST